MNILDYAKRKQENKKISMVTCYDYCSASILNTTSIDTLLVGDSISMVLYGYPNTLSATVEMMAQHTAAVAKGAPNKMIIADMPFCSYRKDLATTVTAAETLMRAGAHAVKLEGASGNMEAIQHLVDSGIPVMGHLGLTPQSVNTLGGFKVQGGNAASAKKILQDAKSLTAAGCFSIVLECMPSELAQEITNTISIPTIGIGAGPYTSGQVLVWHDVLGLSQSFQPKFLKTYLQGHTLIRDALNHFDNDVKKKVYPDIKEHTYS